MFFLTVRLLAFAAFFAEAMAASAAEEPPVVKELSPTVFQVGEVRLDKRTKSITFPASINMREGAIEYVLVRETGKMHESLLVTKTQPSHIHIAMLLLGAKGGGRADSGPPPAQIDANFLQSAPELTGDSITVSISWKEGDHDLQSPAGKLILNTERNAPLETNSWLYTGSSVSNGNFLAQTDGSIIALVNDPAALINNPGPDSRKDMVWAVQSAKVPPTGTSVEVSITLNSPKPSP